MQAKTVDVGTDATLIHQNDSGQVQRVKVKRASDLTGTVQLGGDSVTTGGGLHGLAGRRGVVPPLGGRLDLRHPRRCWHPRGRGAP